MSARSDCQTTSRTYFYHPRTPRGSENVRTFELKAPKKFSTYERRLPFVSSKTEDFSSQVIERVSQMTISTPVGNDSSIDSKLELSSKVAEDVSSGLTNCENNKLILTSLEEKDSLSLDDHDISLMQTLDLHGTLPHNCSPYVVFSSLQNISVNEVSSHDSNSSPESLSEIVNNRPHKRKDCVEISSSSRTVQATPVELNDISNCTPQRNVRSMPDLSPPLLKPYNEIHFDGVLHVSSSKHAEWSEPRFQSRKRRAIAVRRIGAFEHADKDVSDRNPSFPLLPVICDSDETQDSIPTMDSKDSSVPSVISNLRRVSIPKVTKIEINTFSNLSSSFLNHTGDVTREKNGDFARSTDIPAPRSLLPLFEGNNQAPSNEIPESFNDQRLNRISNRLHFKSKKEIANKGSSATVSQKEVEPCRCCTPEAAFNGNINLVGTHQDHESPVLKSINAFLPLSRSSEIKERSSRLHLRRRHRRKQLKMRDLKNLPSSTLKTADNLFETDQHRKKDGKDDSSLFRFHAFASAFKADHDFTRDCKDHLAIPLF